MSIRIVAAVDQVTAQASGDMSIRLVRTVMDDALPPEHAVLAQSYHRATVTARDAYEVVMTGVLAHLRVMGWPEIGADDLARAARVAQAARAEDTTQTD